MGEVGFRRPFLRNASFNTIKFIRKALGYADDAGAEAREPEASLHQTEGLKENEAKPNYRRKER
jgi:hypothetical protein